MKKLPPKEPDIWDEIAACPAPVETLYTRTFPGGFTSQMKKGDYYYEVGCSSGPTFTLSEDVTRRLREATLLG